MRPIIGITTGEIKNLNHKDELASDGQTKTYKQAIIDAGGAPLQAPITTNPEVLEAYYDKFDAIVLAGGNDLNPELYGQEATDKLGEIDDARDEMEMLLAKWALRDHKPILAICRGMQLLNVLRSGTLFQDIPGHQTSNERKDQETLVHNLKVAPESQLATIINSKELRANTYHHQAIDTLGEGLVETAWSDDGIIEAIEVVDHPYALGVQSHPESIYSLEPKWQLVFESFVERARQNREGPNLKAVA